MAQAKAQAFAHRVIEFGDYDTCVKFFSERNINFNCSNDSGWTVLMSICAGGRIDLVGFVMDLTTNIEASTIPNGTTVLHLASMSSKPDIIKELGSTPNRREKLIKIVDARNCNGDTSLMMACVAKNVTAVRILVLELGANVNHCNSHGMTPLMCAANDPHDESHDASCEIISILLSNNADVNAIDILRENTALHFATLSGNSLAIRQLLEVDSSTVTHKNKAGHTPKDLAEQSALNDQERILLNEVYEKVQVTAQQACEQAVLQLEHEFATINVRQILSKKKNKRKTKTVAPKVQHSPLVSPSSCELESPSIPLHVGMGDEYNENEWKQVDTKKKHRRKIPQQARSSEAKLQPHTTARARRATTLRSNTAPVAASKTPVVPSTGQRVDVPSSSDVPIQPSLIAPTSWPALVKPSPHTPILSDDNRSQTYFQLNSNFHQMLPIAQEMDIPVDAFIMINNMTEADALQGLSISQIDILQEAHLNAYHYLNERKMELLRVLEAQRITAHLELYPSLLHHPS